MTKRGYCRVSTTDQNLGRQLKALADYGVKEEHLYMEKISGASVERSEFERLLKELQEGDVVVVAELTRLSRSTSQLIAIGDEFSKKGIQLVSLKENIDTTTTSGRLMFGMLAVLAQFEREIIVERTKEGLAVAKDKGVKFGRPMIDSEKMDLAIELYMGRKYTVPEICRKTGVTKAPLYRELKKRQLTRA